MSYTKTLGPNGWEVGLIKAPQSLGDFDNNIATWMPAGSGKPSFSAFQTIYGNTVQTVDGFGTMHMAVELEGHFEAVRVIFANVSSTFDRFITKVAVAVADSFVDTKMDASFASLALAPAVKINGQDSGVIPKTTGLYGPASPNLLMTDWVDIASIERSDVVGGKPILLVRAVDDGRKDVTITGPGRGDHMTYWIRSGSDYADGSARKIYTSRVWGDQLRTALTGTNSTPSQGSSLEFCTIFGIQYRCKNKVITLLIDGDSTITSDYSNQTDRGNGWVEKGVRRVSTLKQPIEVCNVSQPAQTSVNYTKYAKYVAELVRPSHIMHLGFTINTATQASGSPASFITQLNSMTADTDIMRAVASNIGAKFIINNGMPRNAGDSTTTSYWNAELGLLVEKFKRSLINGAELSFDAHTNVTDKTNVPYIWTVGLMSIDTTGSHPNLSGRDTLRTTADTGFESFVTNLKNLTLVF